MDDPWTYVVTDIEAVLEPLAGSAPQLPAEWFGDVEHTHRAIDDARGYANLLGELVGRGHGRVSRC